jgi:hypothetical protein
VRLTLREQTEPDGGAYTRVLQRKGTAPPQYPDLDEEDLRQLLDPRPRVDALIADA